MRWLRIKIFNPYSISVEIILCQAFVFFTVIQFFLTKINPERAVINFGILPSWCEYFDEFLLGVLYITGLIKVCKSFFKLGKNTFLSSIILLLLGLYLILLSLAMKGNLIAGIFFLRGEFQSAFFLTILLILGIHKQNRLLDSQFNMFLTLWWFTFSFIVFESFLYMLSGKGIYLRDMATGFFGPGHHADVGIFSMLIFMYGLTLFENNKRKASIYTLSALFIMIWSEFKTGLIFIPIATLITANMNLKTKIFFSTLISLCTFIGLEYIINVNWSTLIRSQTVSWQGSGGRLFLIGWILSRVIQFAPWFGFGPGSVISSTARYFNGQYFSEIDSFGFTGGVPQSVIIIGETGFLGIVCMFILIFLLWKFGNKNRQLTTASILFMAYLGVFAYSILEMQISTVLFVVFYMTQCFGENQSIKALDCRVSQKNGCLT
jgi:hypothetical protein